MPRFSATPFAAALLAGVGLTLSGCSSDDDGQTYGTTGVDDEHVHAAADHADVGPHGGSILELTADHSVHGELVLENPDDPARGTFYLLGGDLKTPVVATSVQMALADPEGEADDVLLDLVPSGGDGQESAEWTFERSRLPGDGVVEGMEGDLTVLIDGQQYETAFAAGPDDHEEHDHEGHDHGEGHDE